jgi:hypothetical protein
MATRRSTAYSDAERVRPSDFGAALAGVHVLALMATWLCILPLTPALVLSALIARQAGGLKRRVLHHR